ncbi:ATP-binding protein [Acidaminobacter hydrogenoformans]|uniref:MinD superfamily P-loop ATPase, contains an inserted ferredoxin domain n=1 Tax=Acidaminobacter hydrogenoformans DSM 2784 TaxID=1120920 RepID=A0A1G5S179_9FIRM|nr:ATP-binding protein [Acidaminobacter hydrogenoformans]SCZ80132.1 MinD superfamily P-loop ATPase, contains an inserted ferredoxin domain [Acidaminobacter hydrogenoformans DSM 2784]
MKQLLILSGKGGTGKTTVASAFVQLSKAKAFADCDVDAPNLHLILQHSDERPTITPYYGLPKAVIDTEACIECDLCRESCRFEAIDIVPEKGGYTSDPFACEGCSVCEAVCPVGAIKMVPAVAGELKLYLEGAVFSTAQLKMGSGTSGKLVTEVKKQLKSAVKEMIETSNEVSAEGAAVKVPLAIIDGSPGIGCPVIASISGVDLVLIVAEPSVSGVSDMKRIVETARQLQTDVVVCVNKHDTNQEQTNEIERLCQALSLPMVGHIPFDNMVVEATNQGRSVVEFESPSAKAIREVYGKVMKHLFEDAKTQAPGFHNIPVAD